ncbi:uncharacterized protein LOC144927706 isoform X3 [Branchiostoma floridae x Branchiostoma belcheri]
MASGKNILTVYIEVEEEKGQEDKKEEKDNKEDDTKAEEKNELDSENLEVVSEDEEELEKEEEEEEGRKTTRHKGTIAAMVVLKIFGLAFFINYLVNVAGQEAFDSCSVPGEKRQACGSWSTSERECLNMGCCYRSPFGVPNAPWCYQKASEKERSILDWMMGNNDDKPSGNEDTEDPPASPHHSPHHRSPDDDHTQHRAPDRHGLMPPNLHRDPSNPNCDNPLHRGDSDVINAYPEDPKVAAIYRDLAWSIPVLFVVMLILCTCLCSCNCCGLTKPPPDYVEQLESDATGDEKGPPATFAVEAEVEGNEKAPPVVYVEAGDYEDPWSAREDAVMSPAQLKELMAKIQQENIIKG